MNAKWRFWETWLKKENPCKGCVCSDCIHNTTNGCAMGMDQKQFCCRIEKKPAHSKEYIALKAEFDRMHKNNDPEVLAISELLCRACRAGNMRLLQRNVEGFVGKYTFYSPLLLGPVYIENYSRDNFIQVKIVNSIWIKFNKNSTVYLRALKTIENAKRQLFAQEAQAAKKRAEEEAAKRAQQKQDLLNLLTDVRARHVR